MASMSFLRRVCVLTFVGFVIAEPITVSLQSKKAAPIRTRGNARRRDITPAEVPLTDWVQRTTDIQWFGPISVGTPLQNFTVIFDTGSPFLILPGINCTDSCGNASRYDPSLSSTYGVEPDLPEMLTFSTGVGVLPLDPYDGPHCIIHNDTVTLGGLALTEFEVWDCYEYASFMTGMIPDGILGLGPSDNFAIQLYNAGELSSGAYSFWLVPGNGVDGTYPYTGELTLGGTDPSKYTGKLTTIPLSSTINNIGAWVLDNPAAYIDGAPILNSSNSNQPVGNGIILFDTGTPFLMTPDLPTATDLYAQISPDIYMLDDLGSWGANCSILDAVAVEFTFTVGPPGGELNITLPKNQFNLGPYPGLDGVCQAVFEHWVEPFIDTADGNRPVWLIGVNLLKEYYTVWDGVAETMGFAKPVGLGNHTGYYHW